MNPMATTTDALHPAPSVSEPCHDAVAGGGPHLTLPADKHAGTQTAGETDPGAVGEHRVTIVGAIVSVALLCLAFRTNLQHFVLVWWTDDNYSHGFLVPLISLYFARQVSRREAFRVRSGVGLGVWLLGIALFGRLATVLIPVGFISDLSFLLGLAGLCALLAGMDTLKRYWFPLFFLIFMIPLPVALYAKIASPLQLLASRIASTVLNATGVPVLCEGNLMTLPGNVRMFVAEACSGMRQLTGFLALTAAVAYLATRPVWYRAVVIVSAVPIAISANVARVTLTGYIMHFLDPSYAAGTFHTIEGLLMMGLGLALLRAECWVLDQFLQLVQTEHPAPQA
jgi:exosortase